MSAASLDLLRKAIPADADSFAPTPASRIGVAIRQGKRIAMGRQSGRVPTPLLVPGALAMLVSGLQKINWHDVLIAMRGFGSMLVLEGIGIAAIGCIAASAYDALACRHEGHRCTARRTGAIGFVAWAISMDIGALVGAWGLRYRLYSRRGLSSEQITRIILRCQASTTSCRCCWPAVVCVLPERRPHGAGKPGSPSPATVARPIAATPAGLLEAL